MREIEMLKMEMGVIEVEKRVGKNVVKKFEKFEMKCSGKKMKEEKEKKIF